MDVLLHDIALLKNMILLLFIRRSSTKCWNPIAICIYFCFLNCKTSIPGFYVLLLYCYSVMESVNLKHLRGEVLQMLRHRSRTELSITACLCTSLHSSAPKM